MDKPFSISDSYKININGLNFSNSHNNNIHVITVSDKAEVAIDVAEFKDKNKQIYNKFYENHPPIYRIKKDPKKEFYMNWILYEISVKLNFHSKEIYKMVNFLYFHKNIIGYTKVADNFCITNLNFEMVIKEMSDILKNPAEYGS
ncbi:hypothetical protein [Staphylococcus shinii]|uniref:hypothetical protein n=1 Tax=Staphylococcus shinii TaxID=2912228 RepID=UPI003CFB6298